MTTIEDLVKKHGGEKEFTAAVDEQLRHLMTENPDYVYPSNEGCSYIDDGNEGRTCPDCEGCIFGRAFQALGATEEGLSDRDKTKFNKILFIEAAICDIIEAPNYWFQIQIDQDFGEPWGNLLKYLPGA